MPGSTLFLVWTQDRNTELAEGDFDLGRDANRHIAFGAGPHRCAGSNLARMNLRIAFEELVPRLADVRLQPGAEVRYHSAMNRAPVSVPITFTPGRRLGPERP